MKTPTKKSYTIYFTGEESASLNAYSYEEGVDNTTFYLGRGGCICFPSVTIESIEESKIIFKPYVAIIAALIFAFNLNWFVSGIATTFNFLFVALLIGRDLYDHFTDIGNRWWEIK